MKLADCVECKRPVLELQGQFEKLDSYYLDSGSKLAASAGWWHTSCLIESEVGAQWCALRLANFCTVRGYTTVAELPRWTVVQQRDILAFGKNGQLLELGKRAGSQNVDGGVLMPHVDRMFTLEREGTQLTDAIKAGFETTGTFPITSVLADLDILDRIVHREALEAGVFRFDPKLKQFWVPGGVTGRLEYSVFIPSELEPYLV